MENKWVKHFKAMAVNPVKAKSFLPVIAPPSINGKVVNMMSPTQQAVQRAELSLRRKKRKREENTIKARSHFNPTVLD